MNEYNHEDRQKSDESIILLKEIREDQIKIKKILLGNGEVGLCEKVRSLEEKDIPTLKEKLNELIDSKKWIVRSVVGAVLIALLSLVIKR